MGNDPAGSYTCGRCGTAIEARTDEAHTGGVPGAGGASPPCPQCGATDPVPLDPRAAPYPRQPSPELLHLQHITPRPPLAPGAMVGMGPYMPLPRSSSPPARWAGDPTGANQWRWWSGDEWTDYVANDGVTTTDPLP